jgi:hypothetical protein
MPIGSGFSIPSRLPQGYPPPRPPRVGLPTASAAPVEAPRPTFQPPQPDPRIADLMTELNKNANVPQLQPNPQIDELKSKLAAPASSDLDALIAQISSGQAGASAVGNISADPQAVAYRDARTRQGWRERETAAARAGASGEGPDSGDIGARERQIAESVGQDVSAYEGNLYGQRRSDAASQALQGAQLTLARQSSDRSATQALLDVLLHQQESQRALEAGSVSEDRRTKQSLLDTLTSEDARKRDAAITDATLPLSLQSSELANAMAQQDLIQKRRQTALGGTDYAPGTQFTATGVPMTRGASRRVMY